MTSIQLNSNAEIVSLTLIAALAKPPDARNAWNRLIELMTFENLPHTVIRAMPQIFLNVSSEHGVADRQRLKGVYRNSWSNNAMRFAASREFFDALHDHGVDYRVIKGGAISAHVGHWGLRRMGDIDVVIAPGDENVIAQILSRLGYWLRTEEEKSLVPPASHSPIEGGWKNKSGALLDLHSVSGKPALFGALFREPGEIRTISGTSLRVPSPNLMFALALWHSKKSDSATDELQTLLDIGTMAHFISSSKARVFVVKSGLMPEAIRLLTVLESSRAIALFEDLDWARRRLFDRLLELKSSLRTALNVFRRILGAPVVIYRRRLTRDQQRKLFSERGWRSRLYQLWLVGGAFSSVERFIHRYLGGFGSLINNHGPLPERDFRVRLVAKKGEPSRLWVNVAFVSRSANPAERQLFVDGKMYGFVPLPEGEPGSYEVTPSRNFVDVSLRSLTSRGESEVRIWEIWWANE